MIDKPELFYMVGTLSGKAVTWVTYPTKALAVAALAGSRSIQKVAPRTYVIVGRG